MTATVHELQVEGLGSWIAGRWTIDPVHSDVSFTVRHMMVSKVRGRFSDVAGEIVTAANPLESTVSATIQLASLDTRNAQRDDHIRSADFFEVETYPTMTFNSTGVRATDDGYAIDGELTLHGVTRPVTLDAELNGFSPDPYGGTRVGFSATTSLNRKDFGIDIEMPIGDGAGVVVGDKVQVSLEIQAVLDQE